MERAHGHLQRQNMTKDDWTALKSLQDNDAIIIKQADKGGAIVVLNSVDYETEVERLLGVRMNYVPLMRDPTPELAEIIGTMVADAVARNGSPVRRRTSLLIKS